MPSEQIAENDNKHSFFSRVDLENFKAFGKRQGVPFRPITLLYGKNSSGKSSFLQSLLYLQEVSRGSSSPDVHEIERHSLKLGGFDRFIHMRKGGILAFDLSLELEGEPEKITIRLEITRPDGQGPVILHQIQIRESSKEDNFLSFQYDEDGRYMLEIGEECPLLENESIPDLKNFFICVVTENNLLPDRVISRRGKELTEISRDAREKLENFLQKVSRKMLDSLEGISYLCGNRDIAKQGVLDGAGAGLDGGQAGGLKYWEELRKDKELRERVNKYLDLLFESRYQIVEDKFFSSRAAAKVAADVQLDMGELPDNDSPVGDDMPDSDEIPGAEEFNEQEPPAQSSVDNPEENARTFEGMVEDELNKDGTESQRNEIRILDNLTTLRMLPHELGFGIGQVIPIVVAACVPGHTVLVEQPETHLHPKQQADLGQVLAANAAIQSRDPCLGSTFIIETHSIHIIERLGKMIRETKEGIDLKAADIGIYYIRRSDEGVQVRTMELNSQGKLSRDWPDDFFNEDMGDLF